MSSTLIREALGECRLCPSAIAHLLTGWACIYINNIMYVCIVIPLYEWLHNAVNNIWRLSPN